VFERIQERASSAIVLITHDLGVVAGVADTVLVMYAGRPVEVAPVDDLFYASRHPYTRGLLGSLPRLDGRDGRLARIEGQPPSLLHPPPGCPFHPRCARRQLPAPCATLRPPQVDVGPLHRSACHFATELPPLSEDTTFTGEEVG
jgi:oligopeptide/dipeptide ABC transporter ATP-binding protein